MQSLLNHITAYLLAILILISTTGFSISKGWCYCINQEYVALFSSGKCCTHEDSAAACEIATTVHEKTCNSEATFAQADIDFQVNDTDDWSIVMPSFVSPLVLPKLAIVADTPIHYYAEQLRQPPSNAPPLPAGTTLLPLHQVWNC